MSAAPGLAGRSRAELRELAAEHGAALYRGDQIFRQIHRQLVIDLQLMDTLPAELRRRLADYRPSLSEKDRHTSGDGQTIKLLLEASDGVLVECVSIRERGRHTVCVSSQVGCAMRCSFCASGLEGMERDLDPAEIVEQVLHIQRLGTPVTNVVFMGMGEPLANYDAVMAAIRILHDPQGLNLGARRITVSTVGIVDGIDRLAGEGLQLGLAVSLHAPDDEIRRRIVPPTRRWPIAQIIAAAHRYALKVGRTITFEYVLLAEVNDTLEHALRLAELVSPLPAKVNVIPYNPVPGIDLREPSAATAHAFVTELETGGVTVTLRREKGRDVQAACGQLRRHIRPGADVAVQPAG